MHSTLLFLHLAGVVVWVGGMFFAHFCLRPVAAAQLQPPQRLPLLAGVLGRFFAAVSLAIVAILLSGFALLHSAGTGQAPWHWHLMMAIGLVMTVIFAVIRYVHYRALSEAVEASDWPTGGAAMNRIRQLVLINLCLGALTVAVAKLGNLLA
ncbi:DUF4149 domain-containing protein [Azonexus sp. IMCC34839]|uniref:DUF4149 domain-containing protein n=1 Tax=Azonexus sp. IMCC34839 TaxID=3133695 RepID=UPI00399A9D24